MIITSENKIEKSHWARCEVCGTETKSMSKPNTKKDKPVYLADKSDKSR